MSLCGSNDSTETGNFKNMINWGNVRVSFKFISPCESKHFTETGNFKNIMSYSTYRDSNSMQGRQRGERRANLSLCCSNDSTEPRDCENTITCGNVRVPFSLITLCGSNDSTGTGDVENIIKWENVRVSFKFI